MSDFFSGNNLAVRAVKKRNGSTGYAIHRPWAKSAILLEYPTLKFANDVARYLEYREQQGEVNSGALRRAAEKYAREQAANG